MAFVNNAQESGALHLHPQQFAPPPASSPPPYFRHPGVPIDPSLEGTIQQHNRSLHSSPQLHVLANPTLQAQHLQQAYYNNGMGTPPPPAHTSPRFAHLSPRQRRHSTPAPYTPPDRHLPSREDISSDETLEDAYIKFVLYCNPGYPLDIDRARLKELFNSSPKSDGKSFSMWSLFELIRKLEAKEIPSWNQLAHDLGVEPPDTAKGQSTQKVQQWTVRLKRWINASRIGSFFDYLLGKENEYYTQVPPPHETTPGEKRAGIPLTEDLALRALDPQFRPKRGRRKAEDQDNDDRGITPDPKRPHVDTGTATTPYPNNDGFVHPGSGYPASAYPQSAVPMSAHPDAYEHDPWTASSMANPNPFAHGYGKPPVRWAHTDTPATPHPMSGMQRLSPNLDAVMEEPQSAMTPSTSKRKRRHGPAVSSAWPSTGNTGSKPRGRPPNNRTLKDGPFSTFPANPNGRETTPGDHGDVEPVSAHPSAHPQGALHAGLATPMTAPHTGSNGSAFEFPSQATSAAALAAAAGPVGAGGEHSGSSTPVRPPSKRQSSGPRGERLSLQVPPRVGGPVHLITPTLTVESPSEPPSAISPRTRLGPPTQYPTPVESNRLATITEGPPTEPALKSAVTNGHKAPSTVSSPGYEPLKRALVADLLRADIRGRKQRLKGVEAKGLSEAILQRLKSKDQDADDEAFRANCAAWMGVGSESGGLSIGGGGKRITVQRFRTNSEGYDSPIDEEDEADNVRETFDVSWSLQLGGLRGEFSIKDVKIHEMHNGGQDPGGLDENGVAAGDWKSRYLLMRQKVLKQEVEMREMKEKAVEMLLL